MMLVVVVLTAGCLPLLVHLIHDIDERTLYVGDHERATRARASAALHNIVMAAAAVGRDSVATQHEARVLRLLEQLRSYCDQLRPANTDVPLFVPGLIHCCSAVFCFHRRPLLHGWLACGQLL